MHPKTKAKHTPEVFTVEEVEPGLFQSVFPSAYADRSALHSTKQDASDYIAEQRAAIAKARL